MHVRLADAALESFTSRWRAGWRGRRRVAMLTASLDDPRYFVAYGTDGDQAFRVEGTWFTDLGPFLAQMDADGAELLPPPQMAPACAGQATFPDPGTVQDCFDAALGKAAA